jgi:hypothetical protein
MPLTLLMAFALLIKEIFLKNFSSVNIPLADIMTSGCLSGLAASFYCDFMKDIKSSRTAANIRGGIIIFIIAYALISLFRGGIPLTERFSPGLTNVMSSIGAIYIWINVINLKQFFSARMLIEKYSESYQGEQLREMLFEDFSLLQYSNELVTKISQNYFYQLVITGIIALFCAIYEIPMPLNLSLLLTVILVGSICIFGFFEIVKWEQYFAGEGIGISAHSRSGRLLAIIALSLLCFCAAILLASDKSLLPFSLITGFINWLFSLSIFEDAQLDQIFRENFADLPDTNRFFYNDIDEINRPSILELILKYGSIILKYGLIILITAGFINFMISPLLNRGKVYRNITFSKKLIRIITEWIRGIYSAIASLINYLKSNSEKRKLKKYNAAEIQRAAENLFGAYSPAKRRDIKRSVTLFARLIIWGSEIRHVDWKPSLAPGEYCGILSASSPPAAIADNETDLQKQNESIIRCGELFEQALYSAEVLSDSEQKEFKDLVEEITAG